MLYKKKEKEKHSVKFSFSGKFYLKLNGSEYKFCLEAFRLQEASSSNWSEKKQKTDKIKGADPNIY